MVLQQLFEALFLFDNQMRALCLGLWSVVFESHRKYAGNGGFLKRVKLAKSMVI